MLFNSYPHSTDKLNFSNLLKFVFYNNLSVSFHIQSFVNDGLGQHISHMFLVFFSCHIKAICIFRYNLSILPNLKTGWWMKRQIIQLRYTTVKLFFLKSTVLIIIIIIIVDIIQCSFNHVHIDCIVDWLNTPIHYTILPFGYERVYLPLCKVADTPFHIQGDDMNTNSVLQINCIFCF